MYLRDGAVRWCTTLKAGRSRVRFTMVSFEFFVDIILPATLSTEPLKELGTMNISWGGKGGQCAGLTNLPTSCGHCHAVWESQIPGTLKACPGLQRDSFTVYNTVLTPYLLNVFDLCVSRETDLIEIIFEHICWRIKTYTQRMTG